MTFSQLIRTRYSVRAFKSSPVEDDKVQAILDAARLAPTAANRQPFRIYVLNTKTHKDQLLNMYSRDWFVQAPLVIGMVAVPEESWVRRSNNENYAVVDATIAFDHLVLQAADLGLGTCWIAAFNPEAARRLLKLPNQWKPVAFTPLGYPADAPATKKRRDMDELVTFYN